MFTWFETTIVLITITIICIVVVYVFLVSGPAIAVHEHAVSVMKIVKTLQELCPLGPFNEWNLLPIGIGSPRCWHRSFPIKILNQDIGVYGSSLLVYAPSMSVIRIIADSDNWSQWIPSESKNLKAKLWKDQPIKGDGVMHSMEIVNEFNERDGYVFTHLSDDNLGWILFWDTKEVFVSFFLVQPLEEYDERCLLTYIFGCYLKSCSKTVAESIIFKLNSIKNATEISSAQVLPFYLNSSVKDKEEPLLSYLYSNSRDDLDLLKRIKSKHKSIVSSKSLLLLPYMQRSITFIKKLKSFELTPIFCAKDNRTLIKTQLKEQRRKNRRCTKSEPNLFAAVNHISYTKHEVSEPITGNIAMEKPICKGRHEEDTNSCDNDDGNLHDQKSNSCGSEFEVILPELSISSQQMADIKTRGNYCASILQMEVLETSAVRLHKNVVDDPPSTGKWFYFGTIKGILIMSKIHFSGSLKILSFICEVEVPVKREEVWAFVKNPYCRFFCDDSVKRLKILEQIAPDKKIVHVYHEIGLIKKEYIDFCLLQNERQEQLRSYLAFISVEFENCPLMEGVTRGTLFPSGFVVETGSSGNESTSVKYLYQTVVNDPDSAFLSVLDHSLANFLCHLKVFVLAKPA